jgi:hypothetical protein
MLAPGSALRCRSRGSPAVSARGGPPEFRSALVETMKLPKITWHQHLLLVLGGCIDTIG